MHTIAALIDIVSPASLYPATLSKIMPATILSRQNNLIKNHKKMHFFFKS